MIIEGAFLKLPELLLGGSAPKRMYEATLASHLAMGVLLELSARNVELPMHRIHIEHPYPKIANTRSPGRADLYVGLEGIYVKGLWYNLYGMKPYNWIEVKFLRDVVSDASTQPKTANAANILLDLLRLCVLVPSRSRDNGRYFLAMFYNNPNKSIAFQRRSKEFPMRDWLQQLFEPGEHTVHVSTDQEPPVFHKTLFPHKRSINNLEIKLRFVTKSFSPIEAQTATAPLYWGYLVRMIDFDIVYSDLKLTYQDAGTDLRSLDHQETQNQLFQRLFAHRIEENDSID